MKLSFSLNKKKKTSIPQVGDDIFSSKETIVHDKAVINEAVINNEAVIKTIRKFKKNIKTKEIEHNYDSSKFGLQTFENTKKKESTEITQSLSFDPRKTISIAETPTKDSYKEMPIHEFGISMLKGMGWNGDYDDEEDV